MFRLILCTILFTCSLCVYGQEVQVPFDSAGRIMVITKELDAQLGLFTDQPGFSEARLFRLQDSSYSLEITTFVNATYSRIRRVLSAQDGRSYLALVNARFQDRAPTLAIDQSGRTALLSGAALWSLFYYGIALNEAIYAHEDWPSAAYAMPFLLSGASTGVIALITARSPVSQGASSLALGGMFQGSLHGWLLTALIQGDNPNSQLGFSLSLASSIVEGVVGYTVATNTGMTEGEAGAINTSAFYGMLAGGMTSAMISGFDVDAGTGVRLLGGLGLAGAVGGVFVGKYLSQQQNYTGGDASILATSAALGATLPLCALAAMQPSGIDVRVTAGVMVAGTVLGMWAGDRLVLGKDFRGSQATIATLSTLGGALLGMGIGIAVQEPRVGYAAAWICAAAGFAYAYSGYADEASALHLHGDLRVQLNPASLALAATNLTPTTSVPFASMTYRW